MEVAKLPSLSNTDLHLGDGQHRTHGCPCNVAFDFRPIKIHVYRNGDDTDPGRVVNVTRREFKHWVVFLDGLTKQLKTTTAVHKLYTIDGRKIDHFEDLEQNGEYVAIEKGSFIPCDYGSKAEKLKNKETKFMIRIPKEEDRQHFLEGAESVDIYLKQQGYGSCTGLPYPLDGVAKSPSCSYLHSFTKEPHGGSQEKLNVGREHSWLDEKTHHLEPTKLDVKDDEKLHNVLVPVPVLESKIEENSDDIDVAIDVQPKPESAPISGPNGEDLRINLTNVQESEPSPKENKEQTPVKQLELPKIGAHSSQPSETEEKPKMEPTKQESTDSESKIPIKKGQPSTRRPMDKLPNINNVPTRKVEKTITIKGREKTTTREEKTTKRKENTVREESQRAKSVPRNRAEKRSTWFVDDIDDVDVDQLQLPPIDSRWGGSETSLVRTGRTEIREWRVPRTETLPLKLNERTTYYTERVNRVRTLRPIRRDSIDDIGYDPDLDL